MGVIYSSAELIDFAIPTDGAHMLAAELVIEKVPKTDENVMTLVHGSVSEGRFNTRSDLDVLITYKFDSPNDEPVVVDSIKTVLGDITDRTNVKIEANIWPADEPLVARRERMYDRLFANHLAVAMSNPDWCVGEIDGTTIDIASRPLDESIINKVMFNYLTYKHSGVTRAPRQFDENDPSSILALQRTLELPKALGRKAAQRLGIIHPDGRGDFKDVLDESEAGDEFHQSIIGLRAIDQEYSGMLEYFCNNSVGLRDHDVIEYKLWLQSRYSKALSLGLIATTAFTRYLAGY